MERDTLEHNKMERDMLESAAIERNKSNQSGSKPLVIGVDIGGTHVRMGTVDAAYGLEHFEMLPTATLVGDRLLDNLADALARYRAAHALEGRVAALSMGLPSTLNRERTRVLQTPNIPGLDGVDMVDEMRRRLGLPVIIDRDVNMLFRFDVHSHQLPANGVTIGCYFGTGLGNVIAIDGRILLGKHGVAAELGHIPMRGVTEVCGCGNPGCAEAIAAGRPLATLCAVRFPDTPIDELFVRHSGDPLVEEYVHDLALPVATEINMLDPDFIILGGGVLQMRCFPRERLEHFIRLHTRKPFPANDLHLLYARSAQENGVIGAGIHAFHALEMQHKQ